MHPQITFSADVGLSCCAQVALDVTPPQAGPVPMMNGRPALISKRRKTAFLSLDPEAFLSGQCGIINWANKLPNWWITSTEANAHKCQRSNRTEELPADLEPAIVGELAVS
jgi:hypothetical protein